MEANRTGSIELPGGPFGSPEGILAILMASMQSPAGRRVKGFPRAPLLNRGAAMLAHGWIWPKLALVPANISIPCLLTERNLSLTRLCAMKFFSRLVMWLSPITRTRHHLYHNQHRYRIFRLRHVLSVETISAHKTLLFYVVCVPVLLVRRIVSEARI